MVSTVVVVCTDPLSDRFGIWGCLHLDGYGEEDLELVRGKPLKLSHFRLSSLIQEIVAHDLRHNGRMRWSFVS